jgi:hypothetical protein
MRNVLIFAIALFIAGFGTVLATAQQPPPATFESNELIEKMMVVTICSAVGIGSGSSASISVAPARRSFSRASLLTRSTSESRPLIRTPREMPMRTPVSGFGEIGDELGTSTLSKSTMSPTNRAIGPT